MGINASVPGTSAKPLPPAVFDHVVHASQVPARGSSSRPKTCEEATLPQKFFHAISPNKACINVMNAHDRPIVAYVAADANYMVMESASGHAGANMAGFNVGGAVRLRFAKKSPVQEKIIASGHSVSFYIQGDVATLSVVMKEASGSYLVLMKNINAPKLSLTTITTSHADLAIERVFFEEETGTVLLSSIVAHRRPIAAATRTAAATPTVSALTTPSPQKPIPTPKLARTPLLTSP